MSPKAFWIETKRFSVDRRCTGCGEIPRRLQPLLRQGLGACLAVGLGLAGLKLAPALPLEFFAAGAAQLASLFTGQPVLRVANGWLLPDARLDIVVTAACSATDFFLMVAMVIAWRLASKPRLLIYPAIGGLTVAVPFSIFLNALRIVVVAQIHRWIGARLPEVYGPFLHLATGVALFLPSLIALNGLLDLPLSRRPASSS